MKRSIYEDLEIDVDLMMSDPKEFVNQVNEKAAELRKVLTTKSSIREATSVARSEAEKDSDSKEKATEYFAPLEDKIYEDAEQMDLYETFHLIENLKELAKDLEVAFHSRAREEMIRNNPTVEDKKFTFQQYKDLRDSFEAYRDFAKLIKNFICSPLPAVTGNFGGNEKRTYPAYELDGEIYHNHRVVAKKLGYDPNLVKNHMDLMELIQTNGIEEVIVKEITL